MVSKRSTITLLVVLFVYLASAWLLHWYGGLLLAAIAGLIAWLVAAPKKS